MLNYVIMRVLRMIPQLLLISVIAWIIVQLPPGDYLTEYIGRLASSGQTIDQAEIDRLTTLYGLDQPIGSSMPSG